MSRRVAHDSRRFRATCTRHTRDMNRLHRGLRPTASVASTEPGMSQYVACGPGRRGGDLDLGARRLARAHWAAPGTAERPAPLPPHPPARSGHGRLAPGARRGEPDHRRTIGVVQPRAYLRAVNRHLPTAPMLLTQRREPFDGDGWFFEPKWDGWRCVAVVRHGRARLLSRNGNDVNRRQKLTANRRRILTPFEVRSRT